MTTAAQHAHRILEARQLANPARFENELDRALESCRSRFSLSALEGEQQELLTAIVENMRSMSPAECACHPSRLEAELSLLRHLSGRGEQRMRAAA